MLCKLHHHDLRSAAAIAIAVSLAFPLACAAAAGAQDKQSEFAAQAAAGGAMPTAIEVAVSTDSIRARIERLSEREIKQFYLGCSSAAMRGRLGGGETQACSVGYEVLLQRHFGGDFHSLLAWSRSQPDAGDGRSSIDGD